MFHERTKHIDIRMHFVRDVIPGGEVVVKKVHTDDHPSDMLTKAVTAVKF